MSEGSDVKKYSWTVFFLVLACVIQISMLTVFYVAVIFPLSLHAQHAFFYTSYDSTLAQAEWICQESNVSLFIFSQIPSNGYARHGIFEFEASLTTSFNSVEFSELCFRYGWINESNLTLVKATKWYSGNWFEEKERT